MRIRVLWEGKTKDPHLRALLADFSSRISHFVDFAIEELPPARGREPTGGTKLSASERHVIERLKGSAKIFLDVRGREWTSQQFAEWLGRQGLDGRREAAFFIGSPDGFSESFRNQADVLLALSRMTLTHEFARVLLMEQIYRGLTILRGFPYAH